MKWKELTGKNVTFESELTHSNVIYPLPIKGDVTTPSTPQVPPKHPLSTPQVMELLNTIGDNTYSVSVIMEKMQLKDRKHFRKTYINPALENGLIEPTYPDSPRHPNQEYRLTEKGKKLFKSK